MKLPQHVKCAQHQKYSQWVIDPFVSNQSKFAIEPKSVSVQRDLIERQTIKQCSTIFSAFLLKKCEIADFNQRLEYAAPKGWLKYATHVLQMSETIEGWEFRV